MNSLNIHKNIVEKLDYFIDNKKIPHIIFYGPSGSGKRCILNQFIEKIYINKQIIKEYVMYVNCAHGKGIRFIRDELKFFAKTNIQNQNGIFFKSIILFNADNLTTDAQSALRRCIEQFSHTTRFFIVVENTDLLLKPILSRFCNIYIPHPIVDGNRICLHDLKNRNLGKNILSKKGLWLKKKLDKRNNYNTIQKCKTLTLTLYEKGFSALDIMNYIEKSSALDNILKYKLLIYTDKIRKEFRNEKILIYIILYNVLMRKMVTLENIISI
jgi:replication factor C subunit 3/5